LEQEAEGPATSLEVEAVFNLEGVIWLCAAGIYE